MRNEIIANYYRAITGIDTINEMKFRTRPGPLYDEFDMAHRVLISQLQELNRDNYADSMKNPDPDDMEAREVT